MPPSPPALSQKGLLLPRIRVFFNELALHIRWSKFWSFSFSISSSNEYSGLISFGIDWFDLLAVQRTLNSLLQHHNTKASILCHSTIFLFYGPTLTSIHDYWKNHGASLMVQTVKNSPVIQETQVYSLGQGDSLEKGKATPQYSCLESYMNRGVWCATIHGVKKTWTLLSNLYFHFSLEKPQL